MKMILRHRSFLFTSWVVSILTLALFKGEAHFRAFLSLTGMEIGRTNASDPDRPVRVWYHTFGATLPGATFEL
jgi:hypothetical protein